MRRRNPSRFDPRSIPISLSMAETLLACIQDPKKRLFPETQQEQLATVLLDWREENAIRIPEPFDMLRYVTEYPWIPPRRTLKPERAYPELSGHRFLPDRVSDALFNLVISLQQGSHPLDLPTLTEPLIQPLVESVVANSHLQTLLPASDRIAFLSLLASPPLGATFQSGWFNHPTQTEIQRTARQVLLDFSELSKYAGPTAYLQWRTLVSLLVGLASLLTEAEPDFDWSQHHAAFHKQREQTESAFCSYLIRALPIWMFQQEWLATEPSPR